MGNVNCTPADCINMRPGQAASDCFNNTSADRDKKLKINSGTKQELFEEWNDVI